MTNDTTLIGFTITHGATETNSGAGGVWCANYTNSVLSHCVIIWNSTPTVAGGVSLGTLNDCLIASNSASFFAGGVFDSTLNRCTLKGNYGGQNGGGAYGNWGSPEKYWSSFNACVLIGNSTPGTGGGAYGELLNNCLVIGNQAGFGSAASYSLLANCTVVSNSTPSGGTLGNCAARNCIVYYNNSSNGEVDDNITREPLFINPAAGDFHLRSDSPCINAGNNSLLTLKIPELDNLVIFMTNSLDDNLRISGGTVDMGAYEYQNPASKISYAWLQQNGFPLDGSADNADPDGDGINNYQEWRAGTIPSDATSLLQLLTPNINATGATLTWQSQTNITYYLQRTADPAAPFSTIQSNIVGQTGTTSYTDTNFIGNGSVFYRVGVQ